MAESTKSPDNFPCISVVTPSYNQGKFLEQTIRSVLDQSYPNLEYIIIDGGSTDDSIEIIRKYEDRLDYWISEADHGQSHALNKGFSKATGDIFCWINSDDLLASGSLKRVAESFVQNPDTFWVTGACEIIDGDGVVKNEISVETNLPLSLWLTHMKYNRAAILQPSTFWSRHAWQSIGSLREDLHYAFDFEFFYRMRSRFGAPLQLDTCLSKFRLHGDSKSVSQKELFLLEMTNIARSSLRELPTNQEQKIVLAWLKETRVMECFFRQQQALRGGDWLGHWRWRCRGWLSALNSRMNG